MYMWQSWIEIKYCFVAYFEHITEFDTLLLLLRVGLIHTLQAEQLLHIAQGFIQDFELGEKHGGT